MFTIIVTVFNKDKTLKRCLTSILNSSFNDFEILIINDGSTDNSAKIMEQYSKEFKKIIVYNQSNKGVGFTKKLGIQLAKGKYIIFVDADDTINPNLLFILNKEIKKHKPDIIKFNINEINSSKDKNRYISKKNIFKNGKEALYEWSNINIRYGLFPMYCIKNSLLKKSLPCFLELSYYEDVANIPKIIYFANKIIALDYVGYNYYRSTTKLTQSQKIMKSTNFKLAYNNLIQFFEKELTNESELFLIIKHYYDYHYKRKMKEFEIPDNSITKK